MLLTLIIILINMVGPVPAQETETLPLAQRGPYSVGVQTLTFVDDSRDNRELVTEIWYPAIIPEGASLDHALRDATPDASGAPYPLIIYSHGLGRSRLGLPHFTEHLASHGYVVVATDHHDTIAWHAVIDRPLDMLFVLEQVTSLNQEDLVGIVDGNRVGVTGWSLGGLSAILTSGAQIDSEAWPAWCTGKIVPKICRDVSDLWNDVVAYRSQFDPPLEEGVLWPTVADARIQAVLPMAPPGGPIFGEHGLDALTMPVLIMGAIGDGIYGDAVFVYERIQTDHCYLLSFNANHNFPLTALRAPVQHFATAFFGYYLIEQEEYSEYLTAEYVEQVKNLTWGVYEKE
jgi:predicted dienelactone hydrolase